MRHFELTITNPPYDGALHLQILDELTKLSEKVVCVHPGRWIEDVLAKYKGNGATGKKYEHLKKMLTKVKMIRQADGCKMFNIELRQDMMIGVYEMGHDNGGVLPIYTDPKMFFSVLNKIVDYAHNVKSLGDVDEENKIDGIRIEIKEMMPRSGASTTMTELARHYPVCVAGKDIFVDGVGADGKWWSISGKQKCGWTKDEGTPIPHSIQFPTTEIAQSFIDLYRTNVVKNIIHMLKYGPNFGSELKHTPYFNPSEIKTEDDVLNALGITDEAERTWLERPIYDYRVKDFIKYGEWLSA